MMLRRLPLWRRVLGSWSVSRAIAGRVDTSAVPVMIGAGGIYAVCFVPTPASTERATSDSRV